MEPFHYLAIALPERSSLSTSIRRKSTYQKVSQSNVILDSPSELQQNPGMIDVRVFQIRGAFILVNPIYLDGDARARRASM
jgi:hypothetical protein